MKPVIVLVGRPNVGKSTLFNRLTRTRDAIVNNRPGVTRDRLFGHGALGERPCWIVDTGGLRGDGIELGSRLAVQTERAIAECDVAVMVTDGRDGLLPGDHEIAAQLRRSGRPVVLAVNKCEGLDPGVATAEFAALGLGTPQAVSAEHGDGVEALIGDALARVPAAAEPEPPPATDDVPRLVVLGRPNVGKSTLVNALFGGERVLTDAASGTTRDAVRIPLENEHGAFMLIDTAGVRRQARVDDGLEQLSVLKALRAMEEADVVLLVVDAREGVTEQDAHLAGLVDEDGRAMVLIVNKWDGLSAEMRQRVRRSVQRRLAFLGNFETLYVSALHGTGLRGVWPAVARAHGSARRQVAAGEANRLLRAAVEAYPPPMAGTRRIRLKYAHQGGRSPPLIVIHGNLTRYCPESYRRYLVNYFSRALKLVGTRVRVVLQQAENPWRNRSGRGRRAS